MRIALGFNGLLIIALSYMYWTAGRFLETTITTDYWGGKGFPQLIIILALLLLTYDTVVTYKKLQVAKKGEWQEEDKVFEKSGLRLLVVGIALLGLYVFVVEILGYLMATFMLVFILIKVMGYKNNLRAALYTFILVGSTLYIFAVIFGTSLPRGIGILRELSYYLY